MTTLTCPNCGATIRAENINVQQMTAVCGECDSVFKFEPPAAKAKRRKVKQPEHLTLHEDGDLHMRFRTNFRLDQNEQAITAGSFAGIFILASVVTSTAEGPIILPLFLLLAALVALYALALIVYNETHIDMDALAVTVERKPLPNPLIQPREISLHDVTTIRCAETDVSKKEGYDTPRYDVWAETEAGTRRVIVKDVIESYALFISQRMNEHLMTEVDTARLEDFADAVPPLGIYDDDPSHLTLDA